MEQKLGVIESQEEQMKKMAEDMKAAAEGTIDTITLDSASEKFSQMDTKLKVELMKRMYASSVSGYQSHQKSRKVANAKRKAAKIARRRNRK